MKKFHYTNIDTDILQILYGKFYLEDFSIRKRNWYKSTASLINDNCERRKGPSNDGTRKRDPCTARQLKVVTVVRLAAFLTHLKHVRQNYKISHDRFMVDIEIGASIPEFLTLNI